MKRKDMLFLLTALLIPLMIVPLYAVELKQSSSLGYTYGELDVRVHLTGGKGNVLKPGRDIRLTFEVNENAYVIMYNIDSEGFVNLLFPWDGKLQRVEGREVYSLPEEGSGIHWEAGDKTGIEYIHVLAIRDRTMIREDELLFLKQNARLERDERIRMELDPLVAFNMIDEMLIIDAKENPPATDYTFFYINREVDYPRFLCSKCHGADKFSDPYAVECSEVIIKRADYEGDLGYPYPELYAVRHIDEIEAESDYYVSTEYGEISADEWGYEDYSFDNTGKTKVYLTINYRSGYPYYGYGRPYYGFYAGYSWPFWWDSWWWGWGWGWTWGCNWPAYYYHYYPFYSWYYPSYCYWDYCYRSSYWGCYPNYCYYDCVPAYYPRRGITKRSLSYASTTRTVHRSRTITDSRLMRVRNEQTRRRYYDSMKARQVSRGTTGSRAVYYNGRNAVRNKDDVTRRMVDGYNKARRNLRETRETYKNSGESRKRIIRDNRPTKNNEHRDNRYGGQSNTRKRSEPDAGKGEVNKRRVPPSINEKSRESTSGKRSNEKRDSDSKKSTSTRRKSSKGTSPSRKSSSGSKSKSKSTRSSKTSRRTIGSSSSSNSNMRPAPRSSGRSSAPRSGGGRSGGSGGSRGGSSSGGGGRRR